MLGSASADTSGISRQSPLETPHGVPLLPLTVPRDCWYAGMENVCEMPPPPAPSEKWSWSFHTVSVGAGPTAVTEVPPTAVT